MGERTGDESPDAAKTDFNDGGNTWGTSNPFSFIVISLQATLNSLTSILPSQLASASALHKI